MKKFFALMICLGLSGCYVPADYYYDDYVVTDSYAAPAYTTTYVSSAPTVVYEQPAVIYYDSPLLAPRPYHYSAPHHHPHHAAPRPHHAAPHHNAPAHRPSGGGQPHGGGHGPSHGHHK